MKKKTFGSVLVIVLTVAVVAVLTFSRAAAVEAVYPVERLSRAVWNSVGVRVAGIFNAASAAAENARLRREVAALSMLRDDLKALEVENARLRKVLDYKERRPGEWIVAEPLSRSGGAAGVSKIVRLNRGSLAGIREGAVAAVPAGLVGLVTAVTPHTAEVTLLTDSSLMVACELVSESGAGGFGVLTGGGDQLVLRHLEAAAGCRPGALVRTSGEGGVFPRGMTVGVLTDVHPDERGLLREGSVRPAVDFATLDDIFVRREE